MRSYENYMAITPLAIQMSLHHEAIIQAARDSGKKRLISAATWNYCVIVVGLLAVFVFIPVLGVILGAVTAFYAWKNKSVSQADSDSDHLENLIRNAFTKEHANQLARILVKVCRAETEQSKEVQEAINDHGLRRMDNHKFIAVVAASAPGIWSRLNERVFNQFFADAEQAIQAELVLDGKIAAAPVGTDSTGT